MTSGVDSGYSPSHSVNYYFGGGIMGNRFLAFVLIITFSAGTVFANERAFKKIGKTAQVGNGNPPTVEKFDLSLSKNELVKNGLAELANDYWEKCGPWKTVTSRRKVIDMIKKIETEEATSPTATQLEILYKKDHLLAVAGAVSNGNAECSQSWFNIYGVDGSVLKLRYSLGD